MSTCAVYLFQRGAAEAAAYVGVWGPEETVSEFVGRLVPDSSQLAHCTIQQVADGFRSPPLASSCKLDSILEQDIVQLEVRPECGEGEIVALLADAASLSTPFSKNSETSRDSGSVQNAENPRGPWSSQN